MGSGLIILRVKRINLNLTNTGININVNVKIAGVVSRGKIGFGRGGNDQGAFGGGGTLDGDFGIGNDGFIYGRFDSNLVIVGV